MFFAKSFITALISLVLNYDFITPTYKSDHFSNICSNEEISPNFDNFGLKSFSTKNLNCTYIDSKTSDNSSNNIEWDVKTNGYHTSFKMKFNIFDYNKNNCIYGIYIPTSSFLDISDAQDREFPSPQPPKIHFSPLNQTQFEIQHRYTTPNGEKHEIEIFPPNVFCLNDKDEIRKINIKKPNKVRILIPSPSSTYKYLVYYFEIGIPIIAIISHIIKAFI